jgi:anaerobic selenocysteine-containing dehydrogenase
MNAIHEGEIKALFCICFNPLVSLPHWANKQSANKLTHRTLDPRSKIPEFKVSACRIRKAEQPPGEAI